MILMFLYGPNIIRHFLIIIINYFHYYCLLLLFLSLFFRRVITDLKYSILDPSFLCSCSADGSITIWDTRKMKTAVRNTKFPLGVPSEVRWNKHDPLLLLSAHEGRACVWDLRVC